MAQRTKPPSLKELEPKVSSGKRKRSPSLTQPDLEGGPSTLKKPKLSSPSENLSAQNSTPKVQTQEKKPRVPSVIEPRKLSIEDLTSYFWTKYCNKLKLVDLERENGLLPTHFWSLDPELQQKDHSIENFPIAFKHICPDWKNELSLAGKGLGSPVCLLVTMDTIRAVNIKRSLASGFNCKIEKLFARHLKLENQVAQLKKKLIAVGVGTPNRLFALGQTGALKLRNCKYLLVDAALNKKNQTIFSTNQISDDFFKFFKEFCLPNVLEGQIRYWCIKTKKRFTGRMCSPTIKLPKIC